MAILTDFSNLTLLTLVGTIFVSYFVFSYVSRKWRSRSSLPLPPKPPGVPIVGNLPDILKATSKHAQHLLFFDWAKKYGEVFRVQAGPVEEYFINSDKAVKELFDKQSATTSERPRWIVSNEQICNQWNVLLINASSPTWKHQRKVTKDGMTGVPRADANLPFLHFETAKFLHQLMQDERRCAKGEEIWPLIKRYTYSTFSSQTFGMDIPENDDPIIPYIEETGLAQIIGTLPGTYVVDILPVLENLPLALKPWERDAKARFRRDLKWAKSRMQLIKDGQITGNMVDEAFLHRVLADEKHLGFTNLDEAAYLTMMLIIGAADTSAMSTWSFLEAMLRFPNVQAKAQREIEAVVPDRLPVFEDLERIPYVRCLMKEVWRWRPPVALGHPHVTTRDLTYNGMLIPKGARLHLNAYAISHDPARHCEPENFFPERYTNDPTDSLTSMNQSDPSKRDHFAFGAGRRVCPGYPVAERSLAVSIMRLLWAFDIVPVEGVKTKELDPSVYPGPMPGNPGPNMPVRFNPRSEAKAKIVEAEYLRMKQDRGDMVSFRVSIVEQGQ